MSAISIIMPCHNRGHDLTRILQAYDDQNTQESFEIVAIDDASTDTTYEVLTAFRPVRFSLRIEHLEKNQGPAAARNRGIALARSPLILFVGDDILPERDLVAGHLQAHRRHPEKNEAILGRVVWAHDIPQNTLMVHIDGVGAQQFSYHYLRDGHEYDFRHFYTANVSLKRDFLCALDRWFDTDFPYPAFEDAELAFRLTRRGLRIIYSSALLGQHYHYHTIWSFSSRQYHSGRMAWVLIRKHPPVALRILRAQYGRILSFLWQPNAALPPDVTDWLEAQALRLTSFYEWTPHALLDTLYFGVLDYFYFKGLIDGIFGETGLVARVHGTHVRRSLLPLLCWFLREARYHRIPLPEAYISSSLDNLAPLSRASQT